MIKCKYCGKEIDDNSIYCGYCGKEQPQNRHCVKCGHEIDANVAFCGYCGAEQSKQKAEDSVNSQDNVSATNNDEQTSKYINDKIDVKERSSGRKFLGISIAAVIIIACIIGGFVWNSHNDSIVETCDSTTVVEPITEENLSVDGEARRFAEEFIKMVVDANNNSFCYSTNDEYYDRYEQSQTQNEKNILSYCSNGFKSLWTRELKLYEASVNGDLYDETDGPGYAMGEGEIHNLNDYVLHQGDDYVNAWDEMCKITDYSIQGIGMLDGNKRAKCNIGLEKLSCYGDDEIQPMHVSTIELIKEDGKWVVDDINGFRATESSIKRAEDYHYSHGGKQL